MTGTTILFWCGAKAESKVRSGGRGRRGVHLGHFDVAERSPADLVQCFMAREGGWSWGRVSPSCQRGVHLKLKKTNCLKCSSLSLSICMCLVLCTLMGLWSCLYDCAASLSQTFISATQSRVIIYSSNGCVALHTLLIVIWVRGWSRVVGWC